MGFLKSGTWYNIVLAPVYEVMSSNVKVLLKPFLGIGFLENSCIFARHKIIVMKKYSVMPSGYNVSNNTSLLNKISTTSKKVALDHAKKLSKTFSYVSFNIDTYLNGECVKNEFGNYNKEVVIYSTIDYKRPKKQKLVINHADFFGADVLDKLKK